MIEVIQQIRTAEENAEELRKTCRRTVAQVREDAASSGKSLLEQRTRRAAAEGAALVQKAEEQAAAYLEESHAKSRALCDELTASARQKMDQAADFIVERIVGGL